MLNTVSPQQLVQRQHSNGMSFLTQTGLGHHLDMMTASEQGSRKWHFHNSVVQATINISAMHHGNSHTATSVTRKAENITPKTPMRLASG